MDITTFNEGVITFLQLFRAKVLFIKKKALPLQGEKRKSKGKPIEGLIFFNFFAERYCILKKLSYLCKVKLRQEFFDRGAKISLISL